MWSTSKHYKCGSICSSSFFFLSFSSRSILTYVSTLAYFRKVLCYQDPTQAFCYPNSSFRSLSLRQYILYSYTHYSSNLKQFANLYTKCCTRGIQKICSSPNSLGEPNYISFSHESCRISAVDSLVQYLNVRKTRKVCCLC